MKAILLVLIVCVASTYAATGPFNNIMTQIQNLIQNTFSQLFNQINSVIHMKVHNRFDLEQIMSAFNGLLQGVGNSFLQQISSIIFNMTTTVLNPLVGGGVRMGVPLQRELTTRIAEQFSGLLDTLQGLMASLVQNLFGSIVGKRDLDLSSIASLLGINLNQIMSQLQGSLMGLIGNFLSGLSSQRGVLDYIAQVFNIQPVIEAVSQIGGQLYNQFLALSTQLLFAGQQMWQQAIPVFNNLVSELTNHAGNAVQLVSQAVLQLTGVLNNGQRAQQKGIVDTIFQSLGLNAVIDQIQNVGTSLYSQLVSLATQLLFAGQQMWQQATPVFNNLVAELTNHAGNAVQLVSQAVLQLTSVLANGSQMRQTRGITDFISEALGLQQIWSQLQNVGTALYSQFVALSTQLLFSGQQMWQLALPVFNNLVSELTNHAGNAVQLVSQAVLQLTGVLNGRSVNARGFLDWILGTFNLDGVWDQVSTVGSALYSQFLGLLTQLMFAGQQMWQQAIPVFNNLVSELTNHAGNAVQLVSQAVLQLTSVLNGRAMQNRDIIDWIVGAFNLDGVWSQVSTVGSALYSQFLGLLTQLMFAGQQMWQQAIPVFNNLVSELTGHAGNAVQLVSQAVLQLTSVLNHGQ